VTAVAASARARGYWLLSRDGTVYANGSLPFCGSPSTDGRHGTEYTNIVATSTGGGYWIVDNGGDIHAFGDAAPRPRLDSRTAAVAVVAGGAWVISETGAVIVLGEAPSPPDAAGVIDESVVGAAVGGSGAGWLLTCDGRIRALGDALIFGAPAELASAKIDYIGIASTHTGQGYWICGRHGELLGFGDAAFEGSPSSDGATVREVVAFDATALSGYVLVTANGLTLPFGAIDLGPRPAVFRRPRGTAPITGITIAWDYRFGARSP
jgi:hypothetical protein